MISLEVDFKMENITILEIEKIEDLPEYIYAQNPHCLYGNPTFIQVFALIEKRVIGWEHFQPTMNDKEWFGSHLFVHEDYRRKGIAQKIIEIGIENLRTKGVKNLFVGISSDNIASVNLHKKLLFQLSDRKEPVLCYFKRSTGESVMAAPGEDSIYERTI